MDIYIYHIISYHIILYYIILYYTIYIYISSYKPNPRASRECKASTLETDLFGGRPREKKFRVPQGSVGFYRLRV